MEIEGEAPRAPGAERVTKVSVATSGYFAAMRIPLERGRLFSPDEEHTARQVVVVNQAFARAHFPGQDPLGRRVTIHMKAENTPSTIVGVVGDSKQAALGGDVEPMAYWPHPELDYGAMSYVIRAPGSAGLAAAARAAVAELDAAQPAADVRPMTSLLGRSLAGARFHSLLLAIFAAVSLVLAAVGIAGVMAVVVGQRAREIGIRMALGARPRGVVGLVVRRGMALVGIGVIVGVAGALLLGRVLDSLLFSISSTDPVTIALVVAGLLVVALVASLIPARRAARVDPMVALRSE
jgi:putative ABC transport system permease protein